jgi:hypothetical protein
VSFQAYCRECEATVTASPLLDADAFWLALQTDADAEVMHAPTGKPDHRWKLNRHEKANLLKARAEGFFQS